MNAKQSKLQLKKINFDKSGKEQAMYQAVGGYTRFVWDRCVARFDELFCYIFLDNQAE
jgi:hypothetical protein